MAEPTDHLTSAGEYRSYLIRLWQSHADGVWHASAQSIQTGVTLHFPDLAALCLFLRAQTISAPPEEHDAPTDASSASWES